MKKILLPDSYSYFQVGAVMVDPNSIDIKVKLINPHDPEHSISMEFSKISYLQISKAYDDVDGCYLIGSIELNELTLADTHSNEALSNIFSGRVPDEFYRLQIEGDICLDVVAVDYSAT